MKHIRLDTPRAFRGPVNHNDSEWLFNQAKAQGGQDLFVVAMTQGKHNGTWLEIGCGDPIRINNTYLLEKRFNWSGTSIDVDLMDYDMVTPFEDYWQGYYQVIKESHWPNKTIPIDQFPDPSLLESIPYYKNFIQKQITNIDKIPYQQRCWKTARSRTNFFQTDALTFDYSGIPSYCDYLQIDIASSTDNLKMLNVVLKFCRFGVITFEHDAWDHSHKSACVRLESRKILQEHGYEMVINDVTVPPGHGTGIGNEPINFEDWWVDPNIIPRHIINLYQNLHNDGQPKYFYNILF